MAQRIEITVDMAGIFRYERPAFGYGTETAYIYNMTDENGKVYVWKTTSIMGMKVRVADDATDYFETDSKGRKYDWLGINKGDKVRIKATVKGEDEYKGQPQTILTRVKVEERLAEGETYAQRQERLEAEKQARIKAQQESIGENDMVWRMPYRQYKERYSDCETVIDSFKKAGGRSTIEVIIRDGRLKNSGSRFQHYRYFWMRNQDGAEVVYKAISEENAMARVKKEHPEDTWTCVKHTR